MPKTVQELQICILDGFSHFKSQDVKESKNTDLQEPDFSLSVKKAKCPDAKCIIAL